MTLPLVYWVQYKDMLFFPSFLYYVTGTGCISAMLYFGLYVMPDSLKRLKGKKKPTKQILLLPLEKPRAFDPRGQAALTPSGKI